MEGFLRNRNYSPVSVETVEEGLRSIREFENLKFILLNVVLSAERGWEALKRIKLEHPEIIVIVIGIENPIIASCPNRLIHRRSFRRLLYASGEIR